MINFTLERLLLHSKVSSFWRCNNKLSNKYVFKRFVSDGIEFLSPKCKQLSTSKYYSTDCDDDIEYESNYINIDFESIAKNDPEKMKLLKLYQLEVDVMYQQGDKVPAHMRPRDWKELLMYPTRSSRNRYLHFLWLNEMKRQHHKKKQSEKMMEFEMKKARGELRNSDPHIPYNLTGNTMFHRIYEVQMNLFYNYRALQAMMFGYDLIIDCGYCNLMSRNELSSCIKQLVYMLGDNRIHQDPFNLIFCNMDDNNPLYEKLKNAIPTLNDQSFPFCRSAKGYLELYPPEKLVYLSSQSKMVLEKFDPNDVYIIAGVVDKSSGEPLAAAKAKKDKIRTAKFPLDQYLHWGLGIKTLPLNQMVNIMNDLKLTGDWNIALKHIPKRKLMNNDMYQMPENNRSRNERFNLKSIRDDYQRNAVFDLLLKQ